MKKGLLIIPMLLLLLSSCAKNNADVTSGAVKDMWGEGYKVLTFPVNQMYIGNEWMVKQGRPNDTKGPGLQALKDDQTADFNASQQNDILLSLSKLYNFVPTPEIKVNFSKSINTSGVRIIRPTNIGDVAFEKGTWYVTEAVAVRNFASNSNKGLEASVNTNNSGQYGIPLSQLLGNANVKAGGGTTGMAGNLLVLAYKVEKINDSTYQSSIEADKQLSLTQKNLSLPSANLNVSLEYIENKTPEDVIWACDDARVNLNDIKSAWIVTLKDDKKRPIAFPASINNKSNIAISDCGKYSAVIKSSINSNTGAIERIRAKIEMKESKIDPERLTPISAQFSVTLQKESFELEAMK